jgi:hypothetical protein
MKKNIDSKGIKEVITDEKKCFGLSSSIPLKEINQDISQHSINALQKYWNIDLERNLRWLCSSEDIHILRADVEL